MKHRYAFIFCALAILTALSATQLSAQPIAPPAAAVSNAHFDAEAATAAYMATLSSEARANSDKYFVGGYWLLLWDFLAGLLVAWLFLGTGLSRRLRDWSEHTTRFRALQTAIYGALYILISTVVLLPWAAYEGYFREHQYGMSNQSFGAWFSDQMKGLAIGLIMGTIAIVVIYAVFRRAQRTWWIWGSLVTIALLIFAVAIGPVYLEPVFNKFKPLAESPLKDQILSMARANEIPATDVYEFDASKQTRRMSAHVSGLFGTTRISMNDNLLHRGSPEEIKAVLGHEMGHYVLNHVYKGMVFFSIIIIVGFAFLRWSFERLQRKSGERWGIQNIGDVAGLPLLIVLFSLFSFALTPVQNTIGRSIEAEADNYGLNVSRQPDGFAQAALHLAEYRKMQPGALEEWLMYDHPSGWNRIHRSMVWKQEHIQDADIVSYDAEHGGTASAN
ncbi:MAG: M48 family metallopeptidase [Acidobacteriota bacterium]